jgi:hypothetical protein
MVDVEDDYGSPLLVDAIADAVLAPAVPAEALREVLQAEHVPRGGGDAAAGR